MSCAIHIFEVASLELIAKKERRMFPVKYPGNMVKNYLGGLFAEIGSDAPSKSGMLPEQWGQASSQQPQALP